MAKRRPILCLYHCPHFPFPRTSPTNPRRKKVSKYFCAILLLIGVGLFYGSTA